MSTMFGLARLGRDAELRAQSGGDAVCNLSLAFDYRHKGDKQTQWVDAALWGKQAEALSPYLKKGGRVSVILQDVHIDSYARDGETKVRLVGRVMKIDLADSRPADEPQKRTPSPRPSAAGFNSMDDDPIPF